MKRGPLLTKAEIIKDVTPMSNYQRWLLAKVVKGERLKKRSV